MIIEQCMKQEVVSIQDEQSIAQSAHMMVEHHIGTLPVTDSRGILIGLVQMRDLLDLVMPDFLGLVHDFDFVHDFGAVETRLPSPEKLAKPVRTIMHSPISVDENCGLLRAMAILYTNHLLDVPVIDQTGRLVGIASRVDIGVALLENWEIAQKGS